MRRCLLVPDHMVSMQQFRAEVRNFFERDAYPDSFVRWVHVTRDRKRCHVRVEKVESLGTDRLGHPEFAVDHLDMTYDLEPSPYGDFTEVPV